MSIYTLNIPLSGITEFEFFDFNQLLLLSENCFTISLLIFFVESDFSLIPAIKMY